MRAGQEVGLSLVKDEKQTTVMVSLTKSVVIDSCEMNEDLLGKERLSVRTGSKLEISRPVKTVALFL